MKNEILTMLRAQYELQLLDLGGYAHINKNGMHFAIEAYRLPGVGQCSALSMNAMFGLMKMEMLVLTPQNVDAPLLSMDAIWAMGKHTLLCELYDTQLSPWDTAPLDAVKAGGADLPDHDLGSHWYDPLKLSPSLAKRGKKSAAYEELAENFAAAYLQQLPGAAPCDPAAKRTKTAAYVNGLLQNGGPSTDQFVKMIGREQTADLFTRYIFGSAE